MAEFSADSVIDRIVDQNNALWELLTNSAGKSRNEQVALLKRAFPGAKSLNESEREFPHVSSSVSGEKP